MQMTDVNSANTVQEWVFVSVTGPNSGSKDGDPYPIWSLNKNEKGGGYVCARDDECQGNGDVWWGHTWNASPPAGGPQNYPFDEPWQDLQLLLRRPRHLECLCVIITGF